MYFSLFPEQALDASIITPVLIGLLLLFLATEFFGWVFVGYVVPGYLAAVFLTFPESGLAIVIESILTYIIVIGISEGGAKARLWARFFGRERFLLFVYVSVVVRLIMEAVVFARLTVFIQSVTGLSLSNQFFSIGLVLVPLLANSFFKIGLARGLLQSGLITLLTYAVLTYMLIPYTNLNLSKFELTYENLVLDFTASPKLYIILLTGALLASSYNLRYGWDYNGIMMPALLAIAFFMPAKVLSTCGEAIIVAFVFYLLTKLPLIKDLNFGGGRKIVAVFFVGYVLKWILASYFPAIPTMSVTDFFGFGYLLPSLIGVKILQKRSAFQVLLPTLNAAVYSIILGSLIAAVFHLIENTYFTEPRRPIPEERLLGECEEGLLFKDLLVSKAYVLTGGYVDRHQPTLEQLSWLPPRILRAVKETDSSRLCQHVVSGLPPESVRAMECLLREDPDFGEYVLIREHVQSPLERRGQGVYLIRPNAKGPLLQIPYPVSEPFSMEAAYILTQLSDARAILIAGFDEPLSPAEWSNSLATRGTVFQRIHEELSGQDAIQIRTTSRTASTLHARRVMPYSLNVNTLRDELGHIALSWKPPANMTLPWESAPDASFSVLMLSRQTVYRVFPRERFGSIARRLEAPVSVTGLIERWVVEQKDFIHAPHSGRFEPPNWRDLEMLEAEILRRILRLAADEEIDQAFEEQLETIQRIAHFLGYEVIWFTDVREDKSYIILKETEIASGTKGWGTAVFRLGHTEPWMWIVPRPVFESGTLGIVARWFDLYGGRVLFIPGASFRADPFGRNDILSRNVPRSTAHTILNELLRQQSDNADFLTVVVRGAKAERMKTPLLLSSGDELISEAQLVPPARALLEGLRQDGEVELFKGERHQLGLQGLGNPLSGLVRIRRPGHYLTLWVSDVWRRTIYEGQKLKELAQLFDELGVEYTMGESTVLDSWLLDEPLHNGTKAFSNSLLAETLLDYVTNMNIAALRSLLESKGVHVRALADLRATKVFIYAENRNLRCIGVVGGGGVTINELTTEDIASYTFPHCIELSSARRQRAPR